MGRRRQSPAFEGQTRKTLPPVRPRFMIDTMDAARRNLRQLTRYCLVAVFAAIPGDSSSGAALPVPADLGPGDAYHLVFVTTQLTQATSADVGYYNQLAQASADSAGWGASLGLTWRAIVSTPTVHARDNAPINATTSVYNVARERVANGFADMWDGSLATPIRYHASGAAASFDAWTGTVAGVGVPGATLGNGEPNQWAWCGRPSVAGNGWTAFSRPPLSSFFYLYAISEELVVPRTGDFNGDGRVDGADLLIWQRGLGEEFDGEDLDQWRAQFGAGFAQGAMHAAPEPAALALGLGVSAGLIATFGRRRISMHR